MIIEHASKEKSVTVKRWDVAFFSNVLDELHALTERIFLLRSFRDHGSIRASAYAGIPLTARAHSQGVQFLTYNPNSYYNPETWKHLANSADTLVFYMAAKNICDLAEILLRFSKKPAMKLAVIEQATTIHQQVHTTTLIDCAKDFAGKVFSSPSLVIIGDVVKLHEQFNWFNSTEAGTVFHDMEK